MGTPVARPRALGVAGLSNARDLGGLPAADGSRVARHRVYRAELLVYSGQDSIHSSWEQTNAGDLASLGVRTVLDLRSAHEAAATPSAWQEATGATDARSFPIDDGGLGAARDYVDMLLTRRLASFGERHLGEHYSAVLEDRAETLGAAVSVVADGGPVLIHCTEGKDRTGLLVAVILGALGAPSEAIVEDYALSGAWRPDRALAYSPHFEEAGVPLASYRGLYESPPEAMRMALEGVLERYGSMSSYLTERAGVGDHVLARLREALLEPDVPQTGPR